MTQKHKIIQVGAGGWGWSWIDVVTKSDDWELCGIVDLDPEVLGRAAGAYNIPKTNLFGSLKEAAAQVKADAVLIVVPPEIHARVTLEAVSLGLHCLVEKPIADSMKDAHEMVEAAKANNVKLMVSQNYRFKRAPQTVKQLIDRGIIGRIGLTHITFQKAPPFDGFRTKMAHPLITDMAIHHFDQIRGLLGLEPTHVRATSFNPTWSWFNGDPVATVIFEGDRFQVVYTGSWVSRGWETSWDGDWHIQGEDGEIHWANNTVTLQPSSVFTSVFVPGAREVAGRMEVDLISMDVEDRWASLREFKHAIVKDRPPITSGKDNIGTLALVLGAREAAESNQRVLLSEVIESV